MVCVVVVVSVCGRLDSLTETNLLHVQDQFVVVVTLSAQNLEEALKGSTSVMTSFETKKQFNVYYDSLTHLSNSNGFFLTTVFQCCAHDGSSKPPTAAH